jgi:hypothetical protein
MVPCEVALGGCAWSGGTAGDTGFGRPAQSSTVIVAVIVIRYPGLAIAESVDDDGDDSA